MNRAPLSAELQTLRNEILGLPATLEAESDWYGSVYIERKATQSRSVNLKQSQVQQSLSLGAVLRIYNGYALFEQATDDLSPTALKKAAEKLIERARAQSNEAQRKNLKKRPYQPPTWNQRLAAPLEKEITDQILRDVKATTPVHFGIRFTQDPTQTSPAQRIAALQALLGRVKEQASALGWSADEVTFIQAREGFALEEALFVDREAQLSQTLYRLSLTLITLAGAERTFSRVGGLGGLEALEISDEEIRDQLKNLRAMKTAERLKPGKHRVIFGPVISGILAHEAFGHSQEADTCARGRSKAWDLHLSGEKVGNDLATIVNHPGLFENGETQIAAWGSTFFDEEGWLSSEQVLLDRGKLLQPMTNLTSALRLGIPRSANGKRESWSHGVYTRQTNTYFSAGDHTLEELLKRLNNGYLATQPAGGMEDPKAMGIQVGISYLQEVRDGKLTGKVFKGPSGGDIQMTGYTPEVLNSIEAKSKIEVHSKEKDRARFPQNDVGGCGKYHKESVYAACGGPYLLMNSVTLG